MPSRPDTPERRKLTYLIGGQPRCGKSALATRVREATGAVHLVMDAVMTGFKATRWVPSLIEPAPIDLPFDVWLAKIRDRDLLLTEFMAPIADNLSRVHREPALIDGCFVWPDLVSRFSPPTRSVFVVESGPEHAERLLALRDSTDAPNNWQRSEGFDTDWIFRYAEYNRDRGRRYAAQARATGLPLVDISDYPSMSDAIDAAFDLLVPSLVNR